MNTPDSVYILSDDGRSPNEFPDPYWSLEEATWRADEQGASCITRWYIGAQERLGSFERVNGEWERVDDD